VQDRPHGHFAGGITPSLTLHAAPDCFRGRWWCFGKTP
jgi:hypothetical protein